MKKPARSQKPLVAFVNDPLPTIPPPNDPWAHRSLGMRCKTCMWYAPKGSKLGRCRRHAPTMSGYPVVFQTDWCGDHKLNEETT